MGPGYGYIMLHHIGSELSSAQNSIYACWFTEEPAFLKEAIPGIVCGFQASIGEGSPLLQILLRAMRSWVQIKYV